MDERSIQLPQKHLYLFFAIAYQTYSIYAQALYSIQHSYTHAMMRNITNRDHHYQKNSLSVIKLLNGLLNKVFLSFSRVFNADLFVNVVIISRFNFYSYLVPQFLHNFEFILSSEPQSKHYQTLDQSLLYLWYEQLSPQYRALTDEIGLTSRIIDLLCSPSHKSNFVKFISADEKVSRHVFFSCSPEPV